MPSRPRTIAHASAHVVAGVGNFDYADLDGTRLLAEDVVDGAGNGREIDISAPGHGIIPVERTEH